MLNPKVIINYILTIVVVCATCMSCTHDDSHLRMATVPQTPQGWYYRDSVSVVLPDTLSSPFYDVDVAVRYRRGYPYLNMSLQVDIDMLRTDTLRLILGDSDTRYGRGALSLFYFHQPYMRRVPRALLQRRTIYLRHFMRDDYLPHVEEIGVALLPAVD